MPVARLLQSGHSVPVRGADEMSEGTAAAVDRADCFHAWVMFSNTAHGFGTLEIRSGSLQVRLGRITAILLGAIGGKKRVTTHNSRHVGVFCASVGPPLLVWRNTGVVVRYYGGSAVVVVAAWNRRRVLERLREAGFEVARHETLMDVGLRAVRRRR